MTMNVADVLEQAAQTIKTKGWVQGRYWTKDGLCAREAIKLSCQPSNTIIHAAHYFIKYINVRNLAGGIECWNDDPTNTADNVIHCLEQAAKQWRADNE